MKIYHLTTLQVGSVLNRHRRAVFLIFVIFSSSEDPHKRQQCLSSDDGHYCCFSRHYEELQSEDYWVKN